MNRIEKQVDRIIAGLKVNEALKNVRFIREYGSDEAPSPVNGMIAVGMTMVIICGSIDLSVGTMIG